MASLPAVNSKKKTSKQSKKHHTNNDDQPARPHQQQQQQHSTQEKQDDEHTAARAAAACGRSGICTGCTSAGGRHTNAVLLGLYRMVRLPRVRERLRQGPLSTHDFLGLYDDEARLISAADVERSLDLSRALKVFVRWQGAAEELPAMLGRPAEGGARGTALLASLQADEDRSTLVLQPGCGNCWLTAHNGKLRQLELLCPVPKRAGLFSQLREMATDVHGIVPEPKRGEVILLPRSLLRSQGDATFLEARRLMATICPPETTEHTLHVYATSLALSLVAKVPAWAGREVPGEKLDYCAKVWIDPDVRAAQCPLSWADEVEEEEGQQAGNGSGGLPRALVAAVPPAAPPRGETETDVPNGAGGVQVPVLLVVAHSEVEEGSTAPSSPPSPPSPSPLAQPCPLSPPPMMMMSSKWEELGVFVTRKRK